MPPHDEAVHRTPLTAIDHAWLRMDDPTNQMAVTGVLVFDDPLPLDAVRTLIAERLLLFPRFADRVVEQGAEAWWERSPSFSIDDHLVSAALPEEVERESALQAFCSELMSRPFDTARPRWQFHHIAHYGSGSALVARLHHCIGDGLALIYVLLSMADDGVRPPKARHVVDDENGDGEGWLGVGRAIGTAVGAVLQLPITVARGVRSVVAEPARMVGAGAVAASGVAAVSKLLLMDPDTTTRFKGTLGVPKRVGWSAPFEVATFKRIGKATGCTINDVMVGALAGALRRYLLAGGSDDVPESVSIRGVLPVNLRDIEDAHKLGNQFGLVFLDLPVGLAEPLDRLFAVRTRMSAIKRSPEAPLVYQLLRVAGVSPRPVFQALLDLFAKKATAVVTNVIGPRTTIRFAGAAMSQGMFWVPSAGRLGMGVSLLSYAGRVWLGVQTDAGLVPDPGRLLAHFSDEVSALTELADEPGRSRV